MAPSPKSQRKFSALPPPVSATLAARVAATPAAARSGPSSTNRGAGITTTSAVSESSGLQAPCASPVMVSVTV